MDEKITIRASSLTNWLDCPRRAALAIFEKELKSAGFNQRPLLTNIGAAIGTATHAAAQYAMERKIEHGTIPTLSECADKASESLDQTKREGISFDFQTQSMGVAHLQTKRCVESFLTHVAPTITPVAIEQRLDGVINDNFLLSGKCDALEATEKSNGVRDYKTGTSIRYHAAQLGGYSLLARANGTPIDKMTVDFMQRVPLNKTQPRAVKIEYDVGQSESLALATMKNISTSFDEFAKGGDINAFLPNPSSMLCNEKFCPAWGTKTCTHHTKEIK
jgi:hypothetical protein